MTGASLVGVAAAYWTRDDRLPARIHWSWVHGMLAHVVVLGLWTCAWAWTWTFRASGVQPRQREESATSRPMRRGWSAVGRSMFGSRAGRGVFFWGVPVVVAVGGEVVQRILPGHVANWVGCTYNLIGVGIGFLTSLAFFHRPSH